MSGLGRVAARGASLTLISQLVKFVLQFGSLAVLARLLSPRDFGVVAMVTAITNVAEIVRDFGLSSAAIQAESLDDAERTNLFWANTGIGTACAVVAAACTPLIVAAYDTSVVGPIVLALAWLFVVSGINTQFRAELSRNLRFGALALTDIVAQLASIAVAITMAALGAGYWSIVGQQVALVVITCVMNVLQCRWRPGRLRRDVSIRRFFRFGAGVLGTQVIGYATNNVDNVSIGVYWGSGPLGLYSRGYQLFMVPLMQVNDAMTRVVLPVLSRVQNDKNTYSRYIKRAQLVGCYLLATSFAVAAGLSVPLVRVLFGPQWTQVSPIFAVLAIGGIFRGIGQISYWMYLSRGYSGAQLKLYLYTRPFMITAIVGGLPWGPLGVAWGHLIAFSGYWVVSLITASRAVGVSSRPLFWQAGRTMLLISAPAGGLAWLGQWLVGLVLLKLVVGGALSLVYLVFVTAVSPPERANVQLLVEVARRRSHHEPAVDGAPETLPELPETDIPSAQPQLTVDVLDGA